MTPPVHDLIEAYRKASRDEIRALGRTGQPAERARYAAFTARLAADRTLRGRGLPKVADDLMHEHYCARDVHEYLIGRDKQVLGDTLEGCLRGLLEARDAVASFVVATSDAEVETAAG